MKFMVTWIEREREEVTPAERIAEYKTIFDAFKRIAPRSDVEFLQWVHRADDIGGCAIVETDNAVALDDSSGELSAWYEWDIAPVFDVRYEQALQMFQESHDLHP